VEIYIGDENKDMEDPPSSFVWVASVDSAVFAHDGDAAYLVNPSGVIVSSNDVISDEESAAENGVAVSSANSAGDGQKADGQNCLIM